MKSIKKLRKYRLFDKGSQVSAYMSSDALADEIQAEIAERYMLLPVDADGVPIHIGDTVEGKLPDNTTVKGTVTTYHIHGNDEPDTVYIKVDCDGGGWTIKELKVKHCRHVKPDPVKELLEEFANNGTPTGDGGVLFEAGLIEQYAAKIRQAVES